MDLFDTFPQNIIYFPNSAKKIFQQILLLYLHNTHLASIENKIYAKRGGGFLNWKYTPVSTTQLFQGSNQFSIFELSRKIEELSALLKVQTDPCPSKLLLSILQFDQTKINVSFFRFFYVWLLEDVLREKIDKMVSLFSKIIEFKVKNTNRIWIKKLNTSSPRISNMWIICQVFFCVFAKYLLYNFELVESPRLILFLSNVSSCLNVLSTSI